jgi:hypothetical protein
LSAFNVKGSGSWLNSNFEHFQSCDRIKPVDDPAISTPTIYNLKSIRTGENMADKGKRDKGGREEKKKGKSIKEKRKEKKEKEKQKGG